MYKIIIFLLISPLFSYGQKSINLLLNDFTFNEKVFKENKLLISAFKNISSHSKYPFRIVDRANLDLVITTRKEEINLMKDFNQDDLESLSIANVHYIVKGELTTIIGYEDYYLTIEFIKFSEKESTILLPMTITAKQEELSNYNVISSKMEEGLDSFVKSHFPEYATSPDILNAQSITERLFNQDSLLKEHDKSLKEKDAEIKYLKIKVETVKDDINVISSIASASKRMTDGEYEGLEILMDISINNPSPENREKAKDELNLNCKKIENDINESYGFIFNTTHQFPDSIKQQALERHKAGNSLRFIGMRNFKLKYIQRAINELGRLESKIFSVCNLEEFVEWANSKGIKASID